jgi:exopolysaccharide production protein ExoZ
VARVNAEPNALPVEPPPTIYTIQALRGIAAVLVVLHHIISMWYLEVLHVLPVIAFRGTTGVDIFFVISGFIMPLTIRRTISPALSAQTFFTRRLERIVPLYWLCTLVKYISLRLSPDLSEHGTGSTWHVVSSFLFIPSFNESHIVQPLLQPGWTLTWEMLFYALIAIALLLGAPLRFFLPPILIGLASLYFVPLPQNVPIDTRTIPLLVEFLLGLALSVRYRKRLQHCQSIPASLATIVGVAAFCTLIFDVPATRYPLVFGGFLATAIVGSALELEQRIGHRIPRLLLLLGDASYSIYLTHWFLVSIFRKVFGHSVLATMSNGALPLLIMVTISCAVGIAVYHFVESPINHYFRVRRRTATQL